jgi:hypothetical protein
VTSTHQNAQPSIGPRCQRAVIEWPLAASTPIPVANAIQKATAIDRMRSRPRIVSPPVRMIANANASGGDIGPHQKSSGSARGAPRSNRHSTSPMFDGLKMCRPR